MDQKGTEEEITYPNIFFTIDNFEEVGMCFVLYYFEFERLDMLSF